MSRIQNPAPDATRRRASTNRKMETIMRLARQLPLTRQVLADQLETATPSQMEFMDQWMNAEIKVQGTIETIPAAQAGRFPGRQDIGRL